MKRFPATLAFVVLGSIFILLACRTSNLIARAETTPTRAATRTVRPTFTSIPPTLPPTDTPPPTSPPIIPTPVPTLRRVPPTRIPAPIKTATPPPPPPTADLYGGYYYRPVDKGCVTTPNTRIQGTVYDNGAPENGVIVRVSDRFGGGPSINDFVTGTDPSDYKHIDPTVQGKYRLALYEGQQNAGNWWVFIIDGSGNPLSPGFLITTQDNGGCTTATVDFVHQ